MHPQTRPVGDLLREWRQHRRLSQLAQALEAEISTKHLSFQETGRARPFHPRLSRRRKFFHPHADRTAAR